MLGEKDKEILKELLKDGKIYFADLGRKCHMTRQNILKQHLAFLRQ